MDSNAKITMVDRAPDAAELQDASAARNLYRTNLLRLQLESLHEEVFRFSLRKTRTHNSFAKAHVSS